VVLGYLVVVLVYALMQRSFIYYPQKQDLDAALAGVERMGGSAWLDADGNWLGWHQGAAGASRRVLVMHGNAGQGSDRSGEPQQVHGPALPRIEQLQILQPRCHREVGLPAAAPAQFPHPREPIAVGGQVGGQKVLQALEELPHPGRLGGRTGVAPIPQQLKHFAAAVRGGFRRNARAGNARGHGGEQRS
jgi:hypothetical protein